MKEKILFIFLFFMSLLIGCLYNPRLAIPDYNIANNYFNNIEIDRTTDINEDKILSLIFLELKKFYICIGPCNQNKYPEIIKFYQDKEKTCFLYSYTSRELYNLEWELKKQLPRSIRFNTEIIIALEQNRAKAITKEEYEQNKDKYKSHPYDPSLCKPDPSYEELYKMKGIK